MPKVDDLRSILAAATSPDEITFVYDNLSSPEWIPALRELGALREPPAAISRQDHIEFPDWPVSRYLARMAPKDPARVAEALQEIGDTDNIRVWRNILDALLTMPGRYSTPFLTRIGSWIHGPYQRALDSVAGDLGKKLIDEGLVDQALALLRSLAMLTAPEHWPADTPWQPISDYVYGTDVPALAAALAGNTREVLDVLEGEAVRWLESGADDSGHGAYSSIWRPAIEDHEQNWEHHDDPLDSLVDAIRDAAVRRVTEHPSETAGIASQLLGLAQGVLKRIGLYVLAVSGDAAPELLSRVVTDPGYFADIQLHHEFYQLVQQRFGQLTTADQARYIALVDEVAKAKTADDSQKDAERRQKWWVWNRLGAVSAYLSGVDKERIEAIQAELGPEDHPDLLSYHQTWSGPTSPVSKTALADMQIDELITFLEEWVPDSESFHPGPSRDGLARELGDIAKADPTRYAPIATQLMRLRPVYAGSYLFGLREAVEGTVEFDVGPVVELCRQVVERTSGVEVPVPQGEDDDSWASIRINVARFLEAVLDRRRDGRAPALQVDPDQMVLRTIIAISHDPDPTPEAEARFGPPNMDGLTYSLNTTRGQAMHAALSYLWWSYRQAPDTAAWSLSADLPLLAPLLDSHLSAEHDPSVAIGAAFGWWLSNLIAADAAWISPRVPELLGDLSTPRQQAAWGAYLMRSRPGKRNYDALQGVYEQYARQLASLDEAPKSSRAAADPVDHAIDHLLLLALHGDLGLDAGPLDEMLRARKPWLTKAIAEEAGRLAHRTPEIEDAIDQGFQRLWARIRTEAEDAPRGPLRDALGEFAWWFASSLRSTWTLPELVRLLGLHVVVDPEFLVLPRLAELAPTEPSQTIQALWLMTPPSDDEWAFRTYDDEIGKVLAIGIASDDELLRERSRSLVDRFVRLGLRGLKRLVAAPAPEAEALPD